MTMSPARKRPGLPCLLAASLFLSLGTGLQAQGPEPVGPFAADARVAIPRFTQDVGVASAIGVDSLTMPTRGLGLVFGAHWYPVHMGRLTIGLGGELLTSRASRTPDVDDVDDDEAEGAPPVAAPTVNAQFSSISPQVSLNFGSNRGWSYLTGGLGWAGFTIEPEDAPVADADSRPRVLNYGGGARWFAKEHLAFTLDLRFYAISAQAAATGRPAYPSDTMMVFSGGVAFK